MNGLAFLQASLRNDHAAIMHVLDRMIAHDWNDVARLAEYHQVEPLLWHYLRQGPLPHDLTSDWRAQFYATALANQARLDELAAICHDLAQHEIQPIVLKGMALAPSVYPNLGTRSMSDIDLLVERHELAVTWAVLSARGYLLAPNSARYWREQFRTGGELRLLNVHHHNTLEVHWWLWAGWWARLVGLHDDMTAMARATQTTLNHASVRRLQPEDELIYLAFHAVVSNQCGAGLGRMLVDCDLLIRHASLDWKIVVDQARRWRLSTVVWFTLYLLDAIMESPLPEMWHRLAPNFMRRTALLTLCPPTELLNGLDPRLGFVRHYGLLALVRN